MPKTCNQLDIINAYASFLLPKFWGAGTAAAADGTKYDLYEQNLLAEYHTRTGSIKHFVN